MVPPVAPAGLLEKEIAALKLEVGPYPNIEMLLAGKSPLEQHQILFTLCKVEHRSAEIDLYLNTAPAQ